MQIGIDGRSLQGSRTGVGRYVYELCRELDRALPNAQFFVYSSVPLEMPVLSDRWILRLDESPLAKHLKPVLWLKYRCGLLCKKDNLDVFWGAATFLPKLHHSIRKVITVYDLNYKVVPHTMGLTHRWSYRLYFEKDAQQADDIVVISKGTAQRLQETFGIKVKTIVMPAIDISFRQASEQEIQQCLKLYNIKYPYILSVATWEPRKNLELLVKTFLDMKNEGLLPYHKLMLVGGKGWKDTRLATLVKKMMEMIVPLGYIPDKYLAPLYTGADVFVFPSIYEGFGMPVLEARACGTKVVTSDIPELREAGGVDAIYVAPTAEGIRNGILAALSQTSKERLIDLSFSSWEDGAKTLAMVLKGE